MKLCSSVDLLHIDQQYKNRVKAYLLNKYCSMSLTDIGKMIGKSTNATRMIIKRFEQQFSQNPDLFTAFLNWSFNGPFHRNFDIEFCPGPGLCSAPIQDGSAHVQDGSLHPSPVSIGFESIDIL